MHGTLIAQSSLSPSTTFECSCFGTNMLYMHYCFANEFTIVILTRTLSGAINGLCLYVPSPCLLRTLSYLICIGNSTVNWLSHANSKLYSCIVYATFVYYKLCHNVYRKQYQCSYKLCSYLQVNNISVLLCTLTNQITITTFSQ